MAGGGNIARPLRVIRVSQSVAGIDFTAEVVKSLPCPVAGRADVEAFPGAQFHAGRDEVQLVMAGMAVAYPQDVVLVRLHAGERHALEPVHDGLLPLRREGFPGGERQDTGRVAVPERQRVD
nr:hypothetical protein [Dickeya undicola]